MPHIVISYRRADRADRLTTRRVFERLETKYGAGSVFMDSEAIRPGTDFRHQIAKALGGADAMLVMIGEKWLGPLKGGQFRIKDPTDWVRIEVETALATGIPIIPVLIGKGKMPAVEQLPESLKDFPYIQAAPIDEDKDFHRDVDQLIGWIEQARSDAAAARAAAAPAVAPIIEQPLPVTRPVEVVPSAPPVEPAKPEAAKPEPTRVAPTPPPADPKPEADDEIIPPVPPSRLRPWMIAGAALILLLGVGITGMQRDWFGGHKSVAKLDSPPSNPVPNKPAAPVKPAEPKSAENNHPADKPPAKIASATGQCSMRVASAAPATAGIGGPFSPVLIVPNKPSEIRAVAVSPDGARIATAGEDGIIRLWDAATFRLVRSLTGHTAAVYSLDFWSDGTMLASAGLDGQIRVWDVNSGTPTRVFVARNEADPAKPIVKQYGVAFYPGMPLGNLRYVDSVGEDGMVRIWDIPENSLKATKHSHDIREGRKPRDAKDAADIAAARSLSFAPSGSGEFITAGYDGTLRFHLESGKIEWIFAHGGKALRVAYSPDGYRVASAGNDDGRKFLKVWNVAERTQFRSYEGHSAHVVALAWSRDNRLLASGGGDKSVRVWNVTSGQLVTNFVQAHAADVEAVAFLSAQGNNFRLISVSEDGTMKLWDSRGGKELVTVAAYGDREYLAFTPAGCYSGSLGIERRFTVASMGSIEFNSEARRELNAAGGFSFGR